MNEELLMGIIKKVEGTGLQVRAVGCDMGNQRVSVRLGLTVYLTVVRSLLDSPTCNSKSEIFLEASEEHSCPPRLQEET